MVTGWTIHYIIQQRGHFPQLLGELPMKKFKKLASVSTIVALTASSFTPAMAAVSSSEFASSSHVTSNVLDGNTWQESDAIAEHRRHRRHRHRRGGVDAGDVIAGVLILGGIAAIADAASKNSRRDRYETQPQPRYDSSNELNQAADKCAYAAEQRAGQDARVERISSVSRDGNGWRVDGVINTYQGSEGFVCGIANGRVEYVQIDQPEYQGSY